MKQEEKIAMGLVNIPNGLLEQVSKEIGRASCRERVFRRV